MGLAGSVRVLGSYGLSLGRFVDPSLSEKRFLRRGRWRCGNWIWAPACRSLVATSSSSSNLGLHRRNNGLGSHLVVLHFLGAGLFQQALWPQFGPDRSAADVDFSDCR